MAIGITVTKETVETLFVKLQLTGLTVGTKYDLFRLRMRYTGPSLLGVPASESPTYSREIPDRAGLWSAVAHRVGWTAPAATVNVNDYECPMEPTSYFLVPTSAGSPFEFAWGISTTYPLSRGVLGGLVDFKRDLTEQPQGRVMVRSSAHLNKYVILCVAEMDEIKYTARGTELAVMGSQYPVYVADTREARRGSIVFKVVGLGQYNDLREIVFPPTGIIWPVYLQDASTPNMLLDDMKVIPLDVTIEQATKADPNVRFVRIDYVEIASTASIPKRSGDNDNAIQHPVANFSISDVAPNRGEAVTLTDTSTGQYDSWDWSVYGSTSNLLGKFYTKGPHKVVWNHKGTKTVKLRVYGAELGDGGPTAGSHSITKKIVVY